MNRRLLVLIGVLVAAVVVLGLIGSLAGRDDDDGPIAGDLPAAQACQAVTDVPPAAGLPKHLNGELTYRHVPPSSGDHNPLPVDVRKRVYTPEDGTPVERVVHNLEHGYVVVWYDPAGADLDLLEQVLDRLEPRKIFAAPWPRGGLPARYVITAWGHEQRCTGVSGEAIQAFWDAHGGTNGDAPEASVP